MFETDSLNTLVIEIQGDELTPSSDNYYSPARIAQLRRELERIRDYGSPADRAHAENALRRLLEIEADQNEKNGTQD
jgi:hypothetical protein